MKLVKSGWQDSNLRPPRPKRGAITGLRYTPKMVIYLSVFSHRSLRRDRDSNPGYPFGVRRFSKPFLSATQAPLLFFYEHRPKAVANVHFYNTINQLF